MTQKSHDLVTGADDIDRRKRDLDAKQQELAAKQTALTADQRELGSAQVALAQARETFTAAIKVRLAKLDVELARLGAGSDAASVDASAGLHARRDLLAARIAAVPVAADGWEAYTRDIGTTFDAIERDLHGQR